MKCYELSIMAVLNNKNNTTVSLPLSGSVPIVRKKLFDKAKCDWSQEKDKLQSYSFLVWEIKYSHD